MLLILVCLQICKYQIAHLHRLERTSFIANPALIMMSKSNSTLHKAQFIVKTNTAQCRLWYSVSLSSAVQCSKEEWHIGMLANIVGMEKPSVFSPWSIYYSLSAIFLSYHSLLVSEPDFHNFQYSSSWLPTNLVKSEQSLMLGFLIWPKLEAMTQKVELPNGHTSLNLPFR